MRAPSVDPAELPMTVVAKVQRKGMGRGKEVEGDQKEDKVKERRQSGGARKERVVKKRWELEEEVGSKEEKARVHEWKPRKGEREGIVRHFEAWVPVQLAEKVRKELEEDGDRQWSVQGRRRVIHEGDNGTEYTYGGKTHKTRPWTGAVGELREEINRGFNINCNLVVINHYRNGDDTLGYHADEEPDMVPGVEIVSVSLGETREMVFKWKGDKKACKGFELKDRDVLTMGGDTQMLVQHAILKESGRRGSRFNLTFRRVFTVEEKEAGKNVVEPAGVARREGGAGMADGRDQETKARAGGKTVVALAETGIKEESSAGVIQKMMKEMMEEMGKRMVEMEKRMEVQKEMEMNKIWNILTEVSEGKGMRETRPGREEPRMKTPATKAPTKQMEKTPVTETGIDKLSLRGRQERSTEESQDSEEEEEEDKRKRGKGKEG